MRSPEKCTNPTFQQQMDFQLWEAGHTEKKAGDLIRGSGSPLEALSHIVHNFLRPGTGEAGDMARGQRALGAMAAMTNVRSHAAKSPTVIYQTASIREMNVYTQAKDGKGIAQDIHHHLKHHHHKHRVMVAQADTGLRP